MQIWVDADACPKVVKNILFKAAARTGISVTLVANRSLRIPNTPTVFAIQVGKGFDVADEAIMERIKAGDLVVTSDIPLAAAAIELGAQALSPRGELFDPEGIKGRLAMRDFMDTLRGAGVDTGGPSAYGDRERNAFANHLDQWLSASLCAIT